MKRMNHKQIITAAFFAAVVGLSSAPLSAGAVSDNSDRNNNSWTNDRGDNNRRIISEWQARRIAQNIFPHKHIVRVVLTGDNNRRDDDRRGNSNNREYQVRFADGSRVDVRARDGRVTYIDNNSRRFSNNNWR